MGDRALMKWKLFDPRNSECTGPKSLEQAIGPLNS